MQDIDYLRKQIDEIDSQLLPLFLKRMECSRQVAEYKQKNNLPILDKDREAHILEDRAAQAPPEYRHPIKSLFSAVMKTSRNLQASEFCQKSTASPILEGFDEMELKSAPIVAYQGIPGANSEAALIKFFGENTSKINTMTFGEVLDAIESGSADYGILPIENSSTGSISGAYDLLEDREFFIVGEVCVDIQHCLVGLPDAKIQDIRCVYSHEQGYMQCKEFFKKYPKMEFQPYYNTAIAAKMIAGLGDISNAAVADGRTAKLYGLQVLADGISSIDTNITRFVVVAKSGVANDKCNKISTMFTLPHQSGTLCNVLSEFSDNGLNLVKIESRPKKDGKFEYLFFVDFEGNIKSPQVADILTRVAASCTSFKILGNYPMA